VLGTLDCVTVQPGERDAIAAFHFAQGVSS
jgi:hypothetical protein